MANNMWDVYWSKFVVKTAEGKEKGDGLLFEDLVKSLLSAKYGIQWKRTGKSHDDNRDFWLLLDDERIWAECKNYHNTIAMDTLAPTLVMAQVYDVNTVLFFSRSAINLRAKSKILAFGEKSSKQIFFYEAHTLEELIWEYRTQLPRKFQPQGTYSALPRQEFFSSICFSQDAITGAVQEDERFVEYASAKRVRYNEVFGLTFYVSNPRSNVPLHLKISFSGEQADRYCFQYLRKDISPEQSTWFEQSLDGGEGCAVSVNMRPIKYKTKLLLPGFLIEGTSNTGICMRKEFKPVEVNCNWVGQTKLIGHTYEDILDKVEERLVQNSKVSLQMLVGSSGTGKTRMLAECVNVFLKYGYSTLHLTGAENFSSARYLTEIIAFLYEIPSAQVLESLTQQLTASPEKSNHEEKNSEAQIALDMLSGASRLQTEEDIIQFVDCYGPLLFEKLSSQRCAITVDNVQFIGKAFQQFLRGYILYSANQNRPNYSIVLVIFNQDYMTAQASELLFDIMHAGIEHTVSEKLTGFTEKSIGRLFLRELIHTPDERFDTLFDAIIDKMSLNPYHLLQAVKYLEEEGTVRVTPEGQGYLLEDVRAWKLISKLSGGISDVLERRLDFVEKQISKEHIFRIFSVLFLFDKIDSELIELFCLKESEIKTLQQNCFLREAASGIYVFDHDIIRAFFLEHNQGEKLSCLDWLKRQGGKVPQRIPYVYDIYMVAVARDDVYTHSILDSIDSYFLPARLAPFFYQTLFERCLEMDSFFENKCLWINCLNTICKRLRSIEGSVAAANYYERGNTAIQSRLGKGVYSDYSPAYRPYVHFYCDILVELHWREDAEALVTSVLNESEQVVPQDQICEDERNVLRAIMLNRQYVAYNNAYPTGSILSKRAQLMRLSRAIIPEIKDPQLRRLIAYLNDSDEGYNFYGYREDKEHLLRLWDRCLEGMPDAAPEKTLNYYRKRLQYDLIFHNFDAALTDLETGRNYLENGLYSHEPMIFNTFFLMAEIMAHLQARPVQSASYIERLLTELTQIQQLLENGKAGDILLLRGVNAFYSKNAEETFFAFRGAYMEYERKMTSRYWIKKALLLENIWVAFTKLGLYEKEYEMEFLPSSYRCPMPPENLVGYRASGIQQTTDELMNLPLI